MGSTLWGSFVRCCMIQYTIYMQHSCCRTASGVTSLQCCASPCRARCTDRQAVNANQRLMLPRARLPLPLLRAPDRTRGRGCLHGRVRYAVHHTSHTRHTRRILHNHPRIPRRQRHQQPRHPTTHTRVQHIVTPTHARRQARAAVVDGQPATRRGTRSGRMSGVLGGWRWARGGGGVGGVP